MAMFSVNTHRFDPYRNYKFQVIIDNQVVPAVFRVSGLIRHTEPVEHREGGDNNLYRVMPGMSRFEPITLQRGLSHDTTFEEWADLCFNIAADSAMSLKNYRKDILINLLNMQGAVVLAYRVYRAWVSEYQALPALDANANCVAVERIVLQHEGWERDKSVTEPTET